MNNNILNSDIAKLLNKKVSSKIIVLSLSITAFLTIGISTTYSLITNTKTLSSNTYTTGILDISYEEGKSLELSNYIPMDDISGQSTTPYAITIRNTGNLTYKFNLSILSTVTDITNIIDPNYLKIQIDDNDPVTLNSLSQGKIYNNLILNANESMELHIRMWLDENTPNTEIGHIYSAKLVATGQAIAQKDNINTTSLGYQTIVSLGLDDYLSSGIYEYKENDSYTYYFKGDINYNYFLFNNAYYRIIRIDEKGNIKMIYSGTTAHDNNYNDNEINDTIISMTNFNDNNQSSSYTYYEESNISSSIKQHIDAWYEKNIKDTEAEQYLIDTIYCNDSRVNEEKIYNSYNRLITNNNPDLSCIQSDSYTYSVELGNGELNYKVGLISADELVLIGNDYINNNVPFWTMTPAKYTDNIAYNFSYSNKLDITNITKSLGVRPVITVSSNNITGTGSKEDPFIIKK